MKAKEVDKKFDEGKRGTAHLVFKKLQQTSV